MKYKTDDLRIESIKAVTPPAEICEEIPISEAAAATTHNAREVIHAILAQADPRLMVVVGPCSIHDPAAAREYAQRLKQVREELARDLFIVMRVYFEKPRTTVGWKGLINDPDLDGSFHINKGLRMARTLLLQLNEMGVPAGTEFLDIITPQYVTDLVSWGAIGARTTESQVHREVASGLSCPVGFKNGTYGTTQIAVDAIRAASVPHNFLSLRKEGNSAIFTTRGNPDCHIILRGGQQPNFDAASIEAVAEELAAAGLPERIMIDFSHANSQKQHLKQLDVGADVARRIAAGDKRIFGAMIESNLVAGRQDVIPETPLLYGQSITDACLGWDETVELLRGLAAASAKRRED
jgi:3-deoxy-7-phosphoheptulonate synthase